MAEARGRYGDDTDATAEDDRQSDSRHVGVAEAKGTFSALIEGVQHRGERYVIERHGVPPDGCHPDQDGAGERGCHPQPKHGDCE